MTRNDEPGTRADSHGPELLIRPEVSDDHPAYEAWMTGTLVYSETFWALDYVGLRDPEPATADWSHPGR